MTFLDSIENNSSNNFDTRKMRNFVAKNLKNMTDLQNNIETRSMLPVGTMLQGGKYRIDHYIASGSSRFLYHESVLTGVPSIPITKRDN